MSFLLLSKHTVSLKELCTFKTWFVMLSFGELCKQCLGRLLQLSVLVTLNPICFPPSNLPAKPADEAQKHRQQYEEMVAQAKKRGGCQAGQAGLLGQVLDFWNRGPSASSDYTVIRFVICHENTWLCSSGSSLSR